MDIILNAKYDLFSVEVGLNNLYSSIYEDCKTVFIESRFNIIELISKLGFIGRGLSRFIDLQFLLGYDFKMELIPYPELSILVFNKYNGVLENITTKERY